MASIYVNYETGTDTNPGTSALPFQHIPFDSRATDQSASVVVASGDVIYIDSGSKYTVGATITIDVPNITLDGKTWGSGTRAEITDNLNATDGGTVFASFFSFNEVDGCTVQGMHFLNCGGPPLSIYDEPVDGWDEVRDAIPADTYSAICIYMLRVDNAVVDDCVFEKVGQWRNAKPFTGTTTGVSGVGVKMRSCTNSRVMNCDFSDLRVGVELDHASTGETTSGILVRGCSWHGHINWGVDLSPLDNGTVSGITFDRCLFYDYNLLDDWTGFGVDGPHVDGIFIRSSSQQYVTWSNIVVKRCEFRSDIASDAGTAAVYISAGPSCDIFNCLFLHDPHSPACLSIGYPKMANQLSEQVIRICGNTFIGGDRCLNITPTNTNADSVLIRNNIFYRQVGASYATVANLNPSNLDCDYNVWHTDDPDQSTKDIIADPGNRTFTEWQALGFDAHSQFTNPGITDVSGVPSGWDLTPTVGAAVLGAGADMTAVYGRDFNGAKYAVPYDIGAVALNVLAGVPEDPEFLKLTAL